MGHVVSLPLCSKLHVVTETQVDCSITEVCKPRGLQTNADRLLFYGENYIHSCTWMFWQGTNCVSTANQQICTLGSHNVPSANSV